MYSEAIMAFAKKTSGKQYDDTNKGVLFVNDKKGVEKRPDKTGKLLIKADDYTPDANGNVLIYLSAWVNQHETHGEIISIKANAPQEK
jgi:hypothetical protein